MSQETLRSVALPYPGSLPISRYPRSTLSNLFNNCNVSYGLPFQQACAKHAKETFHAKHIFIISSGTLARSTSALKDLQAALVSLALANDVIRSEDFLKLPTARTAGTVPPAKPCTVPVICIATTLSGGEFTSACGATDERDNQKHQFIVGTAIQLVILDAELVTNFTPLSLLLQSGIRSVDHSVESICSLY
ncbi:hypothetical protein C8R44DRAFT_868913 [Mycena epipterygia]|nr:hypothetical protein C8R44DRAFT_868913 [Mycena epipterygia]